MQEVFSVIPGKSILAVIPARGGSKRLHRKNILPLGGLPLVAWSIRAARESGVLCDILVSTDDQEIAEVAIAYGARVPWLRPLELASDTASVVDVLLHDLNRYEAMVNVGIDAVMLLQPTSPYRRASTIRGAVDAFQYSNGASIIGVSPAKTHPFWCLVSDEEGGMRPFANPDGLVLRSQDLPPVFEVNGCLYLTDAKYLRESRSIFTKPFRPYFIEDPVESIDIDTPFDWRVAEACLDNYEGGENERIAKGQFQSKQGN